MRKQFYKFLGVGLVNTLFGYSLFSLLVYLNFHYTVAVLISTIIGVLFNFKTTGAIVFSSHDHRLVWKFIVVYSLVYVLNVFGLFVLKLISVDIYVAGGILVFPLALITFMLNKKFVFKR